MSRDLTTAYKNAVTAGTVRPVVLVTAEFDTETLRFWNGLGDFTYDGDTYIGAGKLLKTTDTVETQNIEARGINIELSGIPSSLISTALAEDYQGRPVRVVFAPLDGNGVVIADPMTTFSGRADVMDIEEGSSNSTIRISAESDLIALRRVNERRRTPEDQRLSYDDDDFFEMVASLQSAELVWGQSG